MPDAQFEGTLSVTRFESSPDVNLRAKFPGLAFDIKKRVDSYDALGRPVNERKVVTGLRLAADADLGARVAFLNPETMRSSAITWNAAAFAA